jgi:hypothetical protein
MSQTNYSIAKNKREIKTGFTKLQNYYKNTKAQKLFCIL